MFLGCGWSFMESVDHTCLDRADDRLLILHHNVARVAPAVAAASPAGAGAGGGPSQLQRQRRGKWVLFDRTSLGCSHDPKKEVIHTDQQNLRKPDSIFRIQCVLVPP